MTVGEVARMSSQASDNARDSGKVATEGGEVVNETISGIQSISEAMGASSSSVKKLGESSQKIGEVVNVIKDIAEQTNLLALNATIEASQSRRAWSRICGCCGRGSHAC